MMNDTRQGDYINGLFRNMPPLSDGRDDDSGATAGIYHDVPSLTSGANALETV